MDFERLGSFGILKDGGEEGVSLSEEKRKFPSFRWADASMAPLLKPTKSGS